MKACELKQGQQFYYNGQKYTRTEQQRRLTEAVCLKTGKIELLGYDYVVEPITLAFGDLPLMAKFYVNGRAFLKIHDRVAVQIDEVVPFFPDQLVVIVEE